MTVQKVRSSRNTGWLSSIMVCACLYPVLAILRVVTAVGRGISAGGGKVQMVVGGR